MEQHIHHVVRAIERTGTTIGHMGDDFGHYCTKLSYLKDRYREGRFHLAVLGQFKRGKSTLLNALIGEEMLPMGVVPLTAAPTFIQFGHPPQILIRFQGKDDEEVYTGTSTADRSAYLATYVTEEGNPKNHRNVAEVQVSLPSPILESGVVLIDTPGIGSTYRHNTIATLNFLRECDAALFLISADPPITEVELEFLRQVHQRVPRLFFVLNKIDYLDEREREEALSFYKRILSEHHLWDGRLPIFCLSARNGLRARMNTDASLWASSGMAALESFLVDFLAQEKFSALTEAIVRRSTDIIEEALMEGGIRVKALQLPQHELEEKLRFFEATLKQVERERDVIHDILGGDKKRLTSVIEEHDARMRRDADAFLREIMNQHARSRGSTRSSIEESWAEAIPGYFEERQTELNEDIKQRLLDCLATHEQRLNQLVETLRRTASDLFQVPYKPLESTEGFETKSRPYWVLNTWNTESLPMLKSKEQRLEELVRRNVENIRWSMIQNLDLSFIRFTSRVRERLAETAAATKGAMEAANARRHAAGSDIVKEVEHLTKHMADLEAIKQELVSLQNISKPTPSL